MLKSLKQEHPAHPHPQKNLLINHAKKQAENPPKNCGKKKLNERKSKDPKLQSTWFSAEILGLELQERNMEI